MPEIAAESGVSVGLLYRYFASKEELYLAMCESVTQTQLDDLAVQLGQIPDPRQRLASAVGLFVQSLDVERWGAIVTAGWAEADINPALRDMLRRRCDQLRAFAVMFLREALVRGELDADADLDALSTGIVMLLDGVIGHQAEMGERFDPDLAARSMIALLGPALRPARATEPAR
jgi:AcrR family transcriptional regulator